MHHLTQHTNRVIHQRPRFTCVQLFVKTNTQPHQQRLTLHFVEQAFRGFGLSVQDGSQASIEFATNIARNPKPPEMAGINLK